MIKFAETEENLEDFQQVIVVHIKLTYLKVKGLGDRIKGLRLEEQKLLMNVSIQLESKLE